VLKPVRPAPAIPDVYLPPGGLYASGPPCRIGTLLGAADVNIEAAQLSQDTDGEGATIMLRLNRDVPGDVRADIAEAVKATMLEVVDLS